MDITILVLHTEVGSICGWALETHTRENDSLPKRTRPHAFREQPQYRVSCVDLELFTVAVAVHTTLQLLHSTLAPHLSFGPDLCNIQQMMVQLISNAERTTYCSST